jgi:hypothetical protein
MRDLLADIAGPASSASDDDMFHVLANLEKQLDLGHNDNGRRDDDDTLKVSDSSRVFLPPGLMTPSAGAIVVGQTPAVATGVATTTTTANTTGVGQDAFSQSLQQFSAMKLAEDFLKADSARKEQLKNVQEVSDNVVNNLFQGEDLEEYDVQQNVIWNSNRQQRQQQQQQMQDVDDKAPVAAPSSMTSFLSTTIMDQPPPPPPPPPPQQQQVQAQQQENPTETHRAVTSPGRGSGSGQPAMPFASHGVGNYPHPPMFSSNGIPMHPIMAMPPPPPPPLPTQPGHGHGYGHGPSHGHPMYPHYPPYPFPPTAVPPPHVLMRMQQGPMPSGSVVQPVPVALQQRSHHDDRERQSITTMDAKEKKEKPMFSKMDFPALGADESEIEMERKVELEKAKETKDKVNVRRERKIIFDNASPNAAPLPATTIICTSMTSRDLCYVVHAILRPLLSFASVLDAYNADYYRWSYDDRKSRNLLFLGGTTPNSNNHNLPAPVWKETKIKAQEMEDQFRQKVEERADKWSKEQQALGRVAKVNVKRPRALLATTVLSSNVEKTLDSSEEKLETDEDRQRIVLWASRVAIDKGYQSYLNLVELRRLLQSRPGDTWSGEDSVVNRREELLKEVEDNVSKLQASFGLKKAGVIFECDEKVLSRTLMLPKGRMLLSRVIDEGVLPHSSACRVLPSAIKNIFDCAFSSDLTGAPPSGEDRLLRSLAGLVKTVQPSVDPGNLLACLDSTIHADSAIRGEKHTMKSVLTSKRTLMELLYAIFSRGSEVCVGDFEKDWKEKESKFIAILSQN